MNRLWLVILSCILVACSGNSKDVPEPTPLAKFEEEVRLKKLWSKRIGKGSGENYNKMTPRVDGNYIYAADIEGTVIAVGKNDGKVSWKTKLEEPLSSGLGSGESLVVVGTNSGVVFALDKTTGDEIWRQAVSGEVLSSPQVSQGLVIVQTQDGRLFGLDKTDGQQRWLFDSNMPVLSLRGTSAPIVRDDLVYAAFANGKVVCISLDDGAIKWENRVAIAKGTSELERVVDIDGGLLIVDNVLYAVSYQGRVVAIDLASGKKIWKKPASSYVGLGEGFGQIYMSEAGDVVKALSRTGGTPVWVQEGLAYRRLNTPVTINNYVALADSEGYVHLLSQIDGRFVGREKVDGDGVRSDMIVDDENIYVYGNSGRLVALALE